MEEIDVDAALDALYGQFTDMRLNEVKPLVYTGKLVNEFNLAISITRLSHALKLINKPSHADCTQQMLDSFVQLINKYNKAIKMPDRLSQEDVASLALHATSCLTIDEKANQYVVTQLDYANFFAGTCNQASALLQELRLQVSMLDLDSLASQTIAKKSARQLAKLENLLQRGLAGLAQLANLETPDLMWNGQHNIHYAAKPKKVDTTTTTTTTTTI